MHKDGTPTPYFWSKRDGRDHTRETVYKKTERGVKRMKGVYFDAVAKRFRKDG
jgi:hypothetical protein